MGETLVQTFLSKNINQIMLLLFPLNEKGKKLIIKKKLL